MVPPHRSDCGFLYGPPGIPGLAALESYLGSLPRPLDGKPAAVFTTYDIAIGKTLKKMTTPLEARGAKVTGELKSKGPHAAEDFDAWLRTLGT